MGDRLTRGDLPTLAEIGAERMRRAATLDGFPAGWDRFEVFQPFLRLSELQQLRDEVARRRPAGVTVIRFHAALGGDRIADREGSGLPSLPLLGCLHRRASIRFAMGLTARIPDCVGALERRTRWVGSGCTCLVVAVERAEEVEMDLGRAVVFAHALARRLHRAGRRERRAVRRPGGVASRVSSRPSASARAARVAASERGSGFVDDAVVASRTRSISPASLSARGPLTDREVADLNRRFGVAAPGSRVSLDGRVLWDE